MVYRACSSFFKRAKLSGKRYPCRQGGGGKCPITRGIRQSCCAYSSINIHRRWGDNFVCRRCRYDKCVAAGMVYEGLMRPAKRITQETSLVWSLLRIDLTLSLSESRHISRTIFEPIDSGKNSERVQVREINTISRTLEYLDHSSIAVERKNKLWSAHQKQQKEFPIQLK